MIVVEDDAKMDLVSQNIAFFTKYHSGYISFDFKASYD